MVKTFRDSADKNGVFLELILHNRTQQPQRSKAATNGFFGKGLLPELPGSLSSLFQTDVDHVTRHRFLQSFFSAGLDRCRDREATVRSEAID